MYQEKTTHSLGKLTYKENWLLVSVIIKRTGYLYQENTTHSLGELNYKFVACACAHVACAL